MRRRELGYPCQRSKVDTVRVTVIPCLGCLGASNTVEAFITLARPWWSQLFGRFLGKEKTPLRVSSRHTRRSLPLRTFPSVSLSGNNYLGRRCTYTKSSMPVVPKGVRNNCRTRVIIALVHAVCEALLGVRIFGDPGVVS